VSEGGRSKPASGLTTGISTQHLPLGPGSIVCEAVVCSCGEGVCNEWGIFGQFSRALRLTINELHPNATYFKIWKILETAKDHVLSNGLCKFLSLPYLDD